ncbi:GTPase Era [Pelomyxa schiedti]|nr:GTPase Era [Pelomyxa schiedti]
MGALGGALGLSENWLSLRQENARDVCLDWLRLTRAERECCLLGQSWMPWIEPQSKALLKCIVLGEPGVGKTSLAQSLFQRHRGSLPRRAHGAIGADFSVFEMNWGSIQVWDTAGQERFQSLGGTFYRGTDCVMLCYSVNDRTSLEKLPLWKQSYHDAVPGVSRAVFGVVGCKSDLQYNCKSPVSIKAARATTKSIGARYCGETSALDWVNIKGPFCYLALLASQANSFPMPTGSRAKLSCY